MIDETHNPDLVSWVESAAGHCDFPIQNLPLGVFSPGGRNLRIGTAIGDSILDLAAILEMLPAAVRPALATPTLNALFGTPGSARLALRRALSRLLCDPAQEAALAGHLHPADDCSLGLPAVIGDYTDFYVGIHHATNIGRLFRPDTPLLPNYKHVPIGYHGRASSVRPSGEPVVRPNGQRRQTSEESPLFGPTRRLDYELELGVWIAGGNALGDPVAIDGAWNHIAGIGLLNDWSARDVQAWEYQPLGPFLAKSFHTTVSPWIVTAEALAPFRTAQAPRRPGDPRPLAYLWSDEDQRTGALSVELQVSLSSARMRSAGMPAEPLSRSKASDMYWTVAQMVTHHASNGCNLRPADLLGTGTISAATREGQGSLMELSRGGAEPIKLPTGETRAFLEDGDEVTLSASARAPGYAPIGFGPCRAIITPART